MKLANIDNGIANATTIPFLKFIPTITITMTITTASRRFITKLSISNFTSSD